MPEACNLGYLGGRGRRISSSRPTQAKLAQGPYLKNKIDTEKTEQCRELKW
jgi:hypothetical protein